MLAAWLIRQRGWEFVSGLKSLGLMKRCCISGRNGLGSAPAGRLPDKSVSVTREKLIKWEGFRVNVAHCCDWRRYVMRQRSLTDDFLCWTWTWVWKLCQSNDGWWCRWRLCAAMTVKNGKCIDNKQITFPIKAQHLSTTLVSFVCLLES